MDDSFVFYASFMEALELVPDEEYAGCVKCILAYAFEGNDIAATQMERIIMALVRPQIDANKKRRKNGEKGKAYGSLGGRPKKETPMEAEENPIGVINETPNVNVNDNANVNDKKKKRFTAPTVEEVKEYCIARNNNVDPESFVAFYDSKGWKVGNASMKDWKAAVITWEKRQKSKASPAGKFANFPQRNDSTNRDNIRQLIAMQRA